MFAREESDENERLCCPNSRGFILHITDNNGLELLRYKSNLFQRLSNTALVLE